MAKKAGKKGGKKKAGKAKKEKEPPAEKVSLTFSPPDPTPAAHPAPFCLQPPPVETEPDLTPWVTLDMHLMNWHFMNFKYRCKTTTCLFTIRNQLVKRHGLLKDLTIHKNEWAVKNEMSDDMATLEDYGILGAPASAPAPAVVNIYYEFTPCNSDGKFVAGGAVAPAPPVLRRAPVPRRPPPRPFRPDPPPPPPRPAAGCVAGQQADGRWGLKGSSDLEMAARRTAIAPSPLPFFFHRFTHNKGSPPHTNNRGHRPRPLTAAAPNRRGSRSRCRGRRGAGR